MSNLISEWKQELIHSDAWMNLGDTSLIKTENPFYTKDKYYIENPHLHILNLMRQERFFSFTCKTLFNKDIAPFQGAILKELWSRAFPMLIMSRGGSKSFILALYALLRATFHQGSKTVIVGAAFRQSKIVFEYAEEIWKNAPLLRDLCSDNHTNGPRRAVDRCTLRIGDSIITACPIGDGCLSPYTQVTYDNCFSNIGEHQSEDKVFSHNRKVWSKNGFVFTDEHYNNGVAPTKKIYTDSGLNIEGTFNHKLKVLFGTEIIWKRLDEMKVGDRILVDRSIRWHKGEGSVTEKEAYALGCMIGDGNWTNQYFLRYTTIDKELIQWVREGTGFAFASNYENDPIHYQHSSKYDREVWLKRWKMYTCYTPDKIIPRPMMYASKQCMASCISGIFDTDGTLQVSTAKGGVAVAVSLSNSSEELIDQIQYILLHFGIISKKTSRKRDEKYLTAYELLITGNDAKLFHERIGFRLTRKREKLVKAFSEKKRGASLADTVPNIKNEMYRIITEYKIKKGQSNPKFYKISAGHILDMKNITREYIDIFLQKYDFTNDKFLNTLKILGNKNIYYDEIINIKDSESITYDIHVPETHEYCANGFFSHNSKIRGQRANYILCDEFSSVAVQIYETVISGFAAVSASPIEKLKQIAKEKSIKSSGLWSPELEINKNNSMMSNQSVISGTAYYGFNHFCDYWKRWCAIVNSRGDQKKLEEIFNGEIPNNFNWKDYSIIRIPSDMLPEGFLDEKNIARQKATVHSSIFSMEYQSVFCVDSNGFFKRSLIEKCVCGKNNIVLPSCGKVDFTAQLKGVFNREYVMGVDPASENDNLAITILECWPEHRRVILQWTTTRKRFNEKKNKTVSKEQDFYSHVVRKIRDLMRLFNIKRIAMDSQGGGIPIMEGLHDPDKIQPGEKPIWPVIDDNKPKDSDGYAGEHILELINFAKAEWVSEANHGMRKDFEDICLLFPSFDAAEIAIAIEQDKIMGRDLEYDTLEDCYMEIEALKDELASITYTQTGITGRDKWDTPETKEAGGKKGRLRKDRYSSLLLANMIGRTLARAVEPQRFEVYGGFASDLAKRNMRKPQPNSAHQNPDWYRPGNGIMVKRGAAPKTSNYR